MLFIVCCLFLDFKMDEISHENMISGSEENYNEQAEEMREGMCSRYIPTKGFMTEVKQTFKLSWPLVIITIATYCMAPITIMFGGHLGKTELAALSLAESTTNILVLTTLYGFATVCDTVFSQCFGAKNFTLMGIYLQRCIILLLLLSLILITILINMKPLLLLAGQDPDIVELTSQYLLIMSFTVVPISMYAVFKEFIYTQDIIFPDLVIAVSALILYVPLLYVFNTYTHFGIVGLGISKVFICTYMLVATILYFWLSGLYKITWTGWSVKCFGEWGMLLKLGFYGMLLSCLEWWAFEVTLFLAGIIGTTELAAQSIVFSTDMMLYCVPGGISAATAIRVGWYLGSNHPSSAITSSTVGMILSGSLSSIVVIVVLTSHEYIPKLFTNDPDIIHLTSNLLYFIAGYTFFDSLSGVGRNIIRGTGSQKLGTIVVFISNYCIALPIGLSLMFLTSYQLYGLWASFVASLAASALVYIIIIYYFFDWNKLAHDAQVRAGVTEQSLETSRVDGVSVESSTESSGLLNDNTSYGSITEEHLLPRQPQEVSIYTPGSLMIKCLGILFVFLFFISGLLVRIYVPAMQYHVNTTAHTYF